jgi:stage II sporulation protein M
MGSRPDLRAVYRRWLRLYVPAAALVLGASTVVGFLLGSAVPVESLPTGEGGGTNPFPALTTVDLAVNNLVAMLVLSLGAVSLGLVTLLGLVLNGLLIGAVVGIAVQQVDPLVVALLILPHGVLEIPALLVASAVGLRFARLTVRYIRGLEETLVTRRDLREAGWLLLFSALLIVVAAYIEANLTLELAERVAGEELVAA